MQCPPSALQCGLSFRIMRAITLADLKNKHFLALAGNAIIALFGVLTIALLTRSLSKSDVGTWFFFLGIYALGDAIRSGFLGTATIKFYAGTEPQRAANVLGSVWYLATMITALLTIVDLGFLFFIKDIKNEALAVSVQWFGATFVSSLPFNLIFWILVADERYDRVLWLRLVNSASMVIYIIVLMATHQMTLQALLWCNFLTNCLTSIVGLVWGLGRVRTFFKKSAETTMEIVHYGKYSLGSTVVSKLLGNTDTFIITSMLGTTALAIYSIPVKLMEIIEFPLRSFVGTGMSAMAVAYNQKNDKETNFILHKYSGILTLTFIPLTLGAFIFADLAIKILGGPQYVGTEAANIYRLLMLIALLHPADRFIGVTLDIIHKPKINFYKVIIMLIVVVVGDFTGILIFNNVYGIVMASLFTVLAGLFYGYWQLNKFMSFSMREMMAIGLKEARLLIKSRF